jgi:hypothetical protein
VSQSINRKLVQAGYLRRLQCSIASPACGNRAAHFIVCYSGAPALGVYGEVPFGAFEDAYKVKTPECFRIRTLAQHFDAFQTGVFSLKCGHMSAVSTPVP